MWEDVNYGMYTSKTFRVQIKLENPFRQCFEFCVSGLRLAY